MNAAIAKKLSDIARHRVFGKIKRDASQGHKSSFFAPKEIESSINTLRNLGYKVEASYFFKKFGLSYVVRWD